MSEEEKLDKINNHLWWLSTFLVKLPLFMGCLYLIVFATKDCKCSETESQPSSEAPAGPSREALMEADLVGKYRSVDGGVTITFHENHTYNWLGYLDESPDIAGGVVAAKGTWVITSDKANLISLTDDKTFHAEMYRVLRSGNLINSSTGKILKPTE